jgi:saccharopine dehydrogenase-like NADP-dependent oxidoreductase
MKQVLILGAGRSSAVLIEDLLEQGRANDWKIVVADGDLQLAKERVGDHPNGEAITLNVTMQDDRAPLIEASDLVISMVPAKFHWRVVKDCLQHKTPMLSASYEGSMVKIDEEDEGPRLQIEKEKVARLKERAKKAGVLIVAGLGLDPGIDHMSSKQVIDRIQSAGGKLTAYRSFTGGLVAPESDDNPWQYKFTWNPRNVVLAGQGVAQYIRNGRYKYIPYHQLFNRTEVIHVPDYGDFEGYANRDSLIYREAYGLDEIPTIIRGTLRKVGFCRSWNHLVQLGMTDDSYTLENCAGMSYRDFTNTFLFYHDNEPVEVKLAHYLSIEEEGPEMDKLRWLGLFDDTLIGEDHLTPAQILQQILEAKWTLASTDKDMIVMHHQFVYEQDDQEHELHSSMVVIGKDATDTAMATTVGMPLAIFARLVLQEKVDLTGFHIPTEQAIYEPVLQELKHLGIDFVEEVIS